MYALPLADCSVDSIILHQVLHYAQQPGTAIAEAARVLTPEGQLLVIDFAQHASMSTPANSGCAARHDRTPDVIEDVRQLGGFLDSLQSPSESVFQG